MNKWIDAFVGTYSYITVYVIIGKEGKLTFLKHKILPTWKRKTILKYIFKRFFLFPLSFEITLLPHSSLQNLPIHCSLLSLKSIAFCFINCYYMHIENTYFENPLI